MRNIKLFALTLMAVSICGFLTAQSDLSITAPDINPAPLGNVANSGTGCLTFKIQNINLPGYPSAGDTEVTIVMENIMPTDGLNSLTTTPESAYAWSYDGAFTFTGVQINPIGFLYDEEVMVCFDVIADSPCPTEQNGYTATAIVVNGEDGSTVNNVAVSLTCTLETIVPVTYGFFDAVKKGRTSLLSWSTETEVNNERFDILRSSDGQSFEVIGQVAGEGNTIQRVDYEFVDESPIAGKNYYRLSQVDFDDSKHLSIIRTVVFDAAKSIRMFPNPASDLVKFELTSDVERIDVFDVTGKKMKSVDVLHTSSIDIKDLINGAYLVKFLDKTGAELQSEKLIVTNK